MNLVGNIVALQEKGPTFKSQPGVFVLGLGLLSVICIDFLVLFFGTFSGCLLQSKTTISLRCYA